MRLNQIEQVIAVATAGSISTAAQELFISQPNLSASIRDLEKELGQKLFERSGKGVRLTEFGREFLAYAEPVLRSYGSLTDFCKEVTMPPIQRLTVASQCLRFASMLFAKLSRECDSPLYELSLLEGTAEEIAHWVHSQQADLGLIAQTDNQKKANEAAYKRHDLIYTPLCRQSLSVTFRQGHPLQEFGPALRQQQLKGYPLVLYRDINYGNSEFVKLATNGLESRKIIVNSRAALHEILDTTDAFTFSAHRKQAYTENSYYGKTCNVPLSDRSLELELGYLVSRSRPLSPLAQKYLSYIREAIGPVK